MSTFVFSIAVWGASAALGAGILIALGWATLVVTALRRLGTEPNRPSGRRPAGATRYEGVQRSPLSSPSESPRPGIPPEPTRLDLPPLTFPPSSGSTGATAPVAQEG